MFYRTSNKNQIYCCTYLIRVLSIWTSSITPWVLVWRNTFFAGAGGGHSYSWSAPKQVEVVLMARTKQNAVRLGGKRPGGKRPDQTRGYSYRARARKGLTSGKSPASKKPTTTTSKKAGKSPRSTTGGKGPSSTLRKNLKQKTTKTKKKRRFRPGTVRCPIIPPSLPYYSLPLCPTISLQFAL